MATREFRLRMYRERLRSHPTPGEFMDGMENEDLELFLEDVKGHLEKSADQVNLKENLKFRKEELKCYLSICNELREVWKRELEKAKGP